MTKDAEKLDEAILKCEQQCAMGTAIDPADLAASRDAVTQLDAHMKGIRKKMQALRSLWKL